MFYLKKVAGLVFHVNLPVFMGSGPVRTTDEHTESNDDSSTLADEELAGVTFDERVRP